MPLKGGDEFAGFTIVGLLGTGGMGEVYLAKHPRLPRRDALKILPADVSADPEFRARFNREANLAATLFHPHIVGVHDRGENDSRLWISMDFVDGTDAAHLVRTHPNGLAVADVLDIVDAVADALDFAHDGGLLHRDVKPANILITTPPAGRRRILLADFGIARDVNDISGLTATNMTVGTVAYCAPEQLLGEEIDGRADQYALAATAYHLLTGAQLFPHSNPAVVISRHLNTPPPTLADTRRELARLDPVLTVGLAKNPEERFPRCVDFAVALSASLSGSAAAPSLFPDPAAPTRPAVVGPTVPTATSSAAHPRRWLVLAAVAAAILLVAVAVLLWRSWLPSSPSVEATPTASRSVAATSGAPSSTTTPGSSTFQTTAPVVAPLPPTTTTQSIGIALPACYRNVPISERPTTISLACKGHWVEDVTWSMWTTSSADGSGMEMVKNCTPDCAGGQVFRNRVMLHFDAPQPATADSGCPASERFYSQMIVAYPDAAAVPQFGPGTDDTVGATEYNGMPALEQFEMDPAC
jgi:serine/threonine protein kinase, bacterial